MRVEILKNPLTYSSFMYYIRGDWNKIDDVNTLIDVGTNDYIIKVLKNSTSTGVGKTKVEQVILTHEHFDHAAGLKHIIREYNPKVISYTKLPGVTDKAYDGMRLHIGDREAVIYHTPGHSHDSICIYVESDKALFSGDTPMVIQSTKGTFTKEYIEAFTNLVNLDIQIIYGGHDDPLTQNVPKILKTSLENVLKSKII